MKRYKIQSGTALTLGGLLLIAAALFLTVYNLQDADRAKREAVEALQQIETMTAEAGRETLHAPSQPEAEEPETRDPQREMPEVEIDGAAYIGTLELPALSLSLPVLSQWSYAGLRQAPCRYKGSAYLDNLIIAAHNYPAHFGRLKELWAGDAVIFTDAEGTAYAYTVTETETLDGAAVRDMEAGDWDLTLFTCTPGGKSRVTVRCVRSERAP